MRNALVVGWKEFRTFFQTPIGWVILFAFTLVGGWFFFSVGQFFIQKQPTMRGLFEFLPWLFLFYAPAVTMRMWAEERRTGTIETLLTLPLKDWEIAVGKYLASLAVVAVWLLCLTPLAGVVAWFGEPDAGPILGGFIGALLLGGAYAAIGCAASAFTENQIISLVVGVIGAFIFLLAGLEPFRAVFPEAIGGFLYQVSLGTHFHAIARGVLDSRDLLYYVSFIGCFLALNIWAVRRTRGGGVRVLLITAIVILVNYLGSGFFHRIDLTDNARYTLSSDTKRILGRLEDDLRLTAYLSADVPAEFTNTRRDIEDLLREFESYAKGRLRVEVIDPDTEEKQKAADAAGIKVAQINSANADKLEVIKAYLGMVVEFGSKTEKLPFVPDTQTLEYDLVRRISRMTRKGDVKVAWQVNDPFGGMQMPGMPRPPASDRHTPSGDLRAMDEVIKTEYETTTVDLKSKVPDEVKALVLCNAGTGLSELQQFHLDQYLMRGGGVIVMADGSEPMSFGGGAMGGGGSPFMRSGAEKLPHDFFSHYGLKINKDAIIDQQCAQLPRRVNDFPLPVYVQYPGFPLAIGDSINQDHPISARFSDIVFLWPSSIELAPKPGVTATDLVKSSPEAKRLDGFIDVSFEKLLDDSSDVGDPKTFDKQFLLVGLLEGNFASYFAVRPLPKELTEEGHDDADGHGHDHGAEDGAGIPFDDLVMPGEGGTEDAESGGGGEGSGGPRLDDGDIPGGGRVRQETPVEGVKAPDPAPVPEAKKEVDYLKQATAPGRIVGIGTSEFVGEGIVGSRAMLNAYFLQSTIDYMTSESLSSLRAKRFEAATFEEPSDFAKKMAWFSGWFAVPLCLAALGVFTHLWRRTIRPAAARRRMAAMRG